MSGGLPPSTWPPICSSKLRSPEYSMVMPVSSSKSLNESCRPCASPSTSGPNMVTVVPSRSSLLPEPQSLEASSSSSSAQAAASRLNASARPRAARASAWIAVVSCAPLRVGWCSASAGCRTGRHGRLRPAGGGAVVDRTTSSSASSWMSGAAGCSPATSPPAGGGRPAAALEQRLADGGQPGVGRDLDVVEADDRQVVAARRTPRPRAASRTPRAWMSDAANTAVGGSRAGQELLGEPAGHLADVGAVAHQRFVDLEPRRRHRPRGSPARARRWR